MEAKSKQRYIRTPARKLRRIINEVRGKSVTEAVNILKFMPYFAAEIVEKNIKSAAANATEQLGALAEELIVSEVYADDGPTYKRARTRAQGRMYKIFKRTSHLTVVVKVSEKLKEKLAEKKLAKKAKTTKQKVKETKPTIAKTEETVEAKINEQEVKTDVQEQNTDINKEENNQ